MATPITDAERDRIVDLARTGMGCRQIALEVGRSYGAVSKVCANAGVTFDRSKTKTATEALKIDLAHRRQQLAEKAMTRAEELLDQLDKPHLVFNFGGRDNTYEEHQLDRPPTGDIRNLVQAFGVLAQRHIDLVRADEDLSLIHI